MPGHLDEERLVNQVRERLVARFHDVPAEIVEAMVLTAHHSMTGPIRDYVPILVERQARLRLQKYADDLVPLDRRPGSSSNGRAGDVRQSDQPDQRHGPPHSGLPRYDGWAFRTRLGLPRVVVPA